MKFTVALLTVVLTTLSPVVDGAFNRLSTFFACTQIDPTCNTNQATGAEIVAASDDGNLLVYSDAEFGKVGFVNIVDPANPLPDGTVNFFPGQPNSVAVRGPYVLAVINTGTIANPTGFLAVIDIVTRAVVLLLDAREHEHLVVHGETEHDAEQKHRQCVLHGARIRDTQVALLKDPYQRAERAADREQIHDDRLDG